MIVRFNYPQPNELLYSVLARYHVSSGNSSLKATMNDLFSTNHVSASMMLPSRVDNLIYNLPLNMLQSDHLIKEHTLFRFFTCFFNEERASNLFKVMKSEKGGSVYGLVGFNTSNMAAPRFLKYCDECKNEMIESGTIYWNRQFQLDEIKYCPRHKTVLNYSSAKTRSYNKQEFLNASQKYFVDTEPVLSNNEYKTHLQWLSNEIFTILSKDFIKRELSWIKGKYMSKLQVLGLANINGRIKVKAMLKEFFQYYDHEFLEILNLDFEEDASSNWLLDSLRNNERQTTTIKHLLILKFLGTSFETFITDSYNKYRPFKEGPWICRNPACHQYNQKIITKIELSYSIDKKGARGLLKHECGYEYFIYENSNHFRVKSYGHMFEMRLKELIKSKKSLRSISRILSMDPKTVVSRANQYGLAHSWNMITYKAVEKNTSLCINDKEKWLKLLNDYPLLSLKELRLRYPALYTRLYRYANNWLKVNKPNYSRVSNSDERIDWSIRDDMLRIKVEDEIESLKKSEEYPNKLSVSRIGKNIGFLSLLEKQLDKIPKTKAILEENVESDDQYRKRRIIWITRKMLNNYEDLVAWKIFREAGIREEYQDDLGLYVDELINMGDYYNERESK